MSCRRLESMASPRARASGDACSAARLAARCIDHASAARARAAHRPDRHCIPSAGHPISISGQPADARCAMCIRYNVLPRLPAWHAGCTDGAGTGGSSVGLHRDLVFGLRMLRKNSLLLIVASLSLGLGIGLNTTVFSAVHAALFRAPAVERADDLVNLYSVKAGVRDVNPHSYADFVDMRARLQSFDALVAHTLALINYDRQGLPTLQFGAMVSSGYFELLETRPQAGRLLQENDFATEAPVIVVSHRFWQSELGGDLSAIGRPVRLGRRVFDLVGVLPADFTGFTRGIAPDIFV